MIVLGLLTGVSTSLVYMYNDFTLYTPELTDDGKKIDWKTELDPKYYGLY